ncbi:MAG: alpha/beta hydrolase [Flammeovirgaceae bacterium]
MNKSIDITINAPYSTSGEITAQTKNIWLVCHGYGQLSEYFIKNFACLDAAHNYVIAPQALSKFYIGGFTGRVGASWMTKFNREVEIENYISLISTIYQNEIQDKDISNCKVILLGFSQGTATITRWALTAGFHFDALVLWAGSFPHDVDHQAAAKLLAQKDFRLTIGTQDEYFNEKRIKDHIHHLNSYGLQPEVTIFEGEHKIYDDVLLEMGF